MDRMEKEIKEYLSNFGDWFKRRQLMRKNNEERWNKIFLARGTYTNIPICVAGFFDMPALCCFKLMGQGMCPFCIQTKAVLKLSFLLCLV
jgi:hypothetical protein